MTVLVAGVDGGQSSTRAAIGDAGGRILGRGTGPAADLVGEPRDSGRQRAAIARALGAAKEAAGLTADVPLAAAVIGLTGYDGDPRNAHEFAPSADTAVVVHDAVVAHAGALAGEAGIVVLAGTGSVAVGIAERGAPYVRAGGWGYFFGDRGSALGIAREAIAWAMGAADRGEPSQLGAAALRFFGAANLHDIQNAFAHGDLSRPALAAFAEQVLAMAPSERPSVPIEAWFVRTIAAGDLAALARAIDGRLPPTTVRRISYAGGVFRNEGLCRAFRSSVDLGIRDASVLEESSVPVEHEKRRVLFVEPAGDPTDGALLLARRLREGEPIAGWAAVG